MSALAVAREQRALLSLQSKIYALINSSRTRLEMKRLGQCVDDPRNDRELIFQQEVAGELALGVKGNRFEEAECVVLKYSSLKTGRAEDAILQAAIDYAPDEGRQLLKQVEMLRKDADGRAFDRLENTGLLVRKRAAIWLMYQHATVGVVGLEVTKKHDSAVRVTNVFSIEHINRGVMPKVWDV